MKKITVCMCDKKIKAREFIMIPENVSEDSPTSFFDHTSFSNPAFHCDGSSRERL